jgi:hypothetical protein
MSNNKKPHQNSNTDEEDDAASDVSELSADIRKRMGKGAKGEALEGDPTRSEE